MSLSRRAFVRRLGINRASSFNGGYITARGREAMVAEMAPGAFNESLLLPPEGDEIRISSNENPVGPGPAAFEALVEALDEGAGRYPTNARPGIGDLVSTLASKWGAERQHITIGTGSGEILENATKAFTGPTRALVTADPSYLQTVGVARQWGYPIKTVPLDANLRLDLTALASAAKGAGMVFMCNPNNPSSTVVGASDVEAFVAEVRRVSPETYILIDEAYGDYVTDPNFQTSIPLALRTPNVFVARTFSKAYGMAALRLGYAVGHADTIGILSRWTHVFNTNNFSNTAAVASLNDPDNLAQEVARNTEARDYTRKFFADAGYESADSQTNFLFVNLRRPASEFRAACAEHNVLVGRDFPPMEKTHCRISIGTMDEMRRATEVFKQVLA